MNYFYNPKEQERMLEARESFSGRLLTDAQFDEAMALTGIIEREIKKNGAFKEKLGDYAHAFSRTEHFVSAKAETVVRDLFKARTGMTMNQMREELMEREQNLPADHRKLAHEAALGIGELIENGVKMSFNRAFAHQGQVLAAEFGITDAGAKRLMKEVFAEIEKADLYEWGKDLEECFYRPQIEAEREAAGERRDRAGSSRSRSGSRTNGRGNGRDDSGHDDHSRDDQGQNDQESDGPRAGSRFRRAARNDGEAETQTAERSAPTQTRQRAMRFSR